MQLPVCCDVFSHGLLATGYSLVFDPEFTPKTRQNTRKSVREGLPDAFMGNSL
jgi:hypothetical protein